jgi:hypothetical protein
MSGNTGFVSNQSFEEFQLSIEELEYEWKHRICFKSE